MHQNKSNPKIDISTATVIMPIAGLATRAREITQDLIPKHLIQLDNGQTVLDVICTNLQAVGFRRFIFCVGFLKQKLIDHITQESWITSPETVYSFDETDAPLGVDGTVLHAITKYKVTGQALIIPGDLMLPWTKLADLYQQHSLRRPDVTLGLTSYITGRTTDVEKIVINASTKQLVACYARTDSIQPAPKGCINLTSAAATMIDVKRYQEMCAQFLDEETNQQDVLLSLRDDILPWVARKGNYLIEGYDLHGEILDMGTPDNIRYGQSHWNSYV